MEYYKPTLIEEKPLQLEEKDISYAKMLLGLSEKSDGFIPLKVEQDVVVQRISRDLYARPESGFRELYNNEVRACRSAEKIFGAKPKIMISLDPQTRDLAIHGTDSTGISIETFKNIYIVIGRSSNFSGEEIGQFGFGRIAYSTMSEIMILETKYRTPAGEIGEYAVMGKNGVGFNILPKPNLDSYGTIVRLVLKPGVNVHHLVDYIRDACAFSKIPTYLDLVSDLEEPGAGSRSDDGKYPKGCVQLNKTFQERAQEEAERSQYYHGRSGGMLVNSFHAVLDGVELYAEFRVGEAQYYDALTHLIKIGKDERLIGSPIEIGIDLPFSYYLVNVLDERKFKPTADRERLREESANTLKEALIKKASQEISSLLGVSTLRDYLSLDEKTAAVFLSERNSRDDDPSSVAHFLPERSRYIRSLLLSDVKVYKEREYSCRYNKRNLASVLAGKTLDEIFFAPFGTKFNRNHVDQILRMMPGATFIQLVPSSREAVHGLSDAEGFLHDEGVLTTGEYVRKNRERLENKLKEQPPSSIRVFESIEGHYSWGRFARPVRHAEIVDCNQKLSKEVIRVPRGTLRKYTTLLSRVKTSYKLTQDSSPNGGEKLQDFAARMGEKIILTSKGKKKIKHLLAPKSEDTMIHIYLYSDQDIARHFSDSSDIKIFSTEDNIFELALFLTYHSIPFSLDTEMAELFDKELEQSRLGEESLSRRNFLHDYSWKKLGDSEILGSIIQVLKEIDDKPMDLLFARAVQGSKDASEVTQMRKSLLARWKLMKSN